MGLRFLLVALCGIFLCCSLQVEARDLKLPDDEAWYEVVSEGKKVGCQYLTRNHHTWYGKDYYQFCSIYMIKRDSHGTVVNDFLSKMSITLTDGTPVYFACEWRVSDF